MAKGQGRDLAVVEFSGHGAVVDGQLYLLPYDVDARTAARIRSSALSAEELRDELARAGQARAGAGAARRLPRRGRWPRTGARCRPTPGC